MLQPLHLLTRLACCCVRLHAMRHQSHLAKMGFDVCLPASHGGATSFIIKRFPNWMVAAGDAQQIEAGKGIAIRVSAPLIARWKTLALLTHAQHCPSHRSLRAA